MSKMAHCTINELTDKLNEINEAYDKAIYEDGYLGDWPQWFEHNGYDLSDLATFGGERPIDDDEIYSWSPEYILRVNYKEFYLESR